MSVRARDAVKVRSPPADWYKLRARKVFARRLDVLLEQALWLKERPPIRILTMQTQWGSCSPNGHITLNPHLVKAPCNCIDYVDFQSGCYQLVLCPSRGSAI
ncbi:MAG: DUF45 domain-containing protein [Advenella sp.]|nr:DUF45 domain-containing protein [Advenella sp.]